MSQIFERMQKSTKSNHIQTKNLLKSYKPRRDSYKPFNLSQLQANKQLAGNRIFSQFMSFLRSYNRRLMTDEDHSDHSAVEYNLNQFIYSALNICNAKTQTEAQLFLKEIDQWHSNYLKKRTITFKSKRPMRSMAQDDLIRKTFKSNLPLEIDQYQRKLCMLNGKDEYKACKTVKNRVSSVSSDSQLDFNNDTDGDEGKKVRQNQLPNLRNYKMEVLKMKKANQEKQEKAMFQALKKNTVRIQFQTTNNFYKPFINNTDIYKPEPADQSHKQNRIHTSFSRTAGQFTNFKKSRMYHTLGFRNKVKQFMTGGEGETIDSIQGMNLMKNPFEVKKTKKGKKK